MSDLYETTNRTSFVTTLKDNWYRASGLYGDTLSSVMNDLDDAVNAVVPDASPGSNWAQRDSAYRDGGGTIEYAITGNTATMKWRPSSTPLAYTEMYLLEWTPPIYVQGDLAIDGTITCTSWWQQPADISSTPPVDPNDLIADLATPWIAKLAYPDDSEQSSVFSESTVAGEENLVDTVIQPNDALAPLGVHSDRPSLIYSARVTTDTDDGTPDIFDTNRAIYVVEMQNCLESFLGIDEDLRTQLGAQWSTMRADLQRFIDFNSSISETRESLKETSSAVKDAGGYGDESDFSNVDVNGNEIFANIVSSINFMSTRYIHTPAGSAFVSPVDRIEGKIGSLKTGLPSSANDRPWSAAQRCAEKFMEQMANGSFRGSGAKVEAILDDQKSTGDMALDNRWTSIMNETWGPNHTNSDWAACTNEYVYLMKACGWNMNTESYVANANNAAHTLWQLSLKISDPKFCNSLGLPSRIEQSETLGIFDDFIGEDLADQSSDVYNFELASSLSQLMNFKATSGVNVAALEVSEASTMTENYSSGFKEWFVKPVAAALEGEDYDSSDFDTWKENFDQAIKDLKTGAHCYLTGGGPILIVNNVFRTVLDMADQDMKADPDQDEPGPLGCQLLVSPDNSRSSTYVGSNGESDYWGDPDKTYEDYRFINYQFMMHMLGRMSSNMGTLGSVMGQSKLGSTQMWEFFGLQCGSIFGNAFAFVPHFDKWYGGWIESRAHYNEITLQADGPSTSYPAGFHPLYNSFAYNHWTQAGYSTSPSEAAKHSGDNGLRHMGCPSAFLWAMPWDAQSHGNAYFTNWKTTGDNWQSKWIPQHVLRTRVCYQGLDNGDVWNPEGGTDHGDNYREEVQTDEVYDCIILRHGGVGHDRTNQFWQPCDIVAEGERNRTLAIPEHSTGLANPASYRASDGTAEMDWSTTQNNCRNRLGDLFYGPPFFVKNLQPLCDYYEHHWDMDAGEYADAPTRMQEAYLPDKWSQNQGKSKTGSSKSYWEQLCNLHWRTNWALPKHFVYMRQFMTSLIDRFIMKNLVCAQTMLQENGETPTVSINSIEDFRQHLKDSLGNDEGVKVYLAYRMLAGRVFMSFIRKHYQSLSSYHDDFRVCQTVYGNIAFNGPTEMLDYGRNTGGDRSFIAGWDPHLHGNTGGWAGGGYMVRLTATQEFANGVFTLGAGYAAKFTEDYVKAQQLFRDVINLTTGELEDFSTDVITAKDYIPDVLEKDSSRYGDLQAIDLYDYQDGTIMEGVLALLAHTIDPNTMQTEVGGLVSITNLLEIDLETGSTSAVRGPAAEIMQDIQSSMQPGYVITQYLENLVSFYDNFLSLRDEAVVKAAEYVDLFELPGIDAQQMVNYGNSYQRNLVAFQKDQSDTSSNYGYIPYRHTRVGGDAFGAVVKHVITQVAHRGNPYSLAKDTVFFGVGVPTNSVPDYIQHPSLSSIIGITREYFSFVIPSFVSTLNIMYYDMNLWLDPAGLSSIANMVTDDDGNVTYSIPEDPTEWVENATFIYIENGQLERMDYETAEETILDQLDDSDICWYNFLKDPETSSDSTSSSQGTTRNKWHSIYEHDDDLKKIPVDVQTGDLYNSEGSRNNAADALAKQILLNHIVSACFEHYYKLFAGLEVNEQCFPTDSESVLKIMINDFAKDEVLSDLGGADDDGVPDFYSELFLSDSINTKGTLVRAISPKMFDRVFHVPCVMDDIWFYSPKVLDAADSGHTSLTYDDVETMVADKGLESHDDFTIGSDEIACVRYPEQDESQGDDLNNNLSGGMEFSIIYSKLDRG